MESSIQGLSCFLEKYAGALPAALTGGCAVAIVPQMLPSAISRVLAALALVLAVFLAYGWSTDLKPVWDDVFLVGSNPFFKSPYLIGEMFHQWLWIEPYTAYYRPVQNLSFLGDYLLWRTWFPGYRVSSLLWHGGAAVLFWRLAAGLLRDFSGGSDSCPDRLEERRSGQESDPPAHGKTWLSRPEALAWAVALIWAVHPAHNAAVAYVSGRADPLAMCFALSGWLFFRMAVTAAQPLHRSAATIAAFACGMLALCSRETGLVWLALFAIYEGAWRSHSSARVRASVWIGALMLTTFYAMLRTLPPALFEKTSAAERPLGPLLWKSVLVLGDYATLFIAPLRLSMERKLIVEGGSGIELLPVVLAFCVVLAGIAFWPGGTRRLRMFCAFWFVIAFLPISPLLAPPNTDSAEHWMYLPFAGLILGGAALWWDMTGKIRRIAVGCVVCWVLLLGVRTHLRAREWRNQDVFMRATLQNGMASPRLLALASINLILDGKFGEAETIQRKSVDRHPKDPLSKIFLGMVLQEKGDVAEALPLLQMTRSQMLAERGTHPRFCLAPAYASACLISMGRNREAEQVLRLGLETWPDGWHIIRNLVVLLTSEHRSSEAIVVLKDFISRNPWHIDAVLHCAVLLAESGQSYEAGVLLEYARTLDIRSPLPDRLMAVLLAENEMWPQSLRYQRQALRRSGGEAVDWRALAILLEKTGDIEGAHAALQKARQ